MIDDKTPPILPYILLIDDDSVVYGVSRTFLKFSANVDYAENTSTAIEKIKTKMYSAILLDINLNEIKNGVDMLKMIRRMNGYEHVPVIACTAYAMVGDRQKLITAGFDEYLAKPFSSSELIEKVDSVLKH